MTEEEVVETYTARQVMMIVQNYIKDKFFLVRTIFDGVTNNGENKKGVGDKASTKKKGLPKWFKKKTPGTVIDLDMPGDPVLQMNAHFNAVSESLRKKK